MKKIRRQVNSIKTPIILISFCFFFVLISVSCVSAASQVYVNTTGNDITGDGTQANPYQTIGKGIGSVDLNGTVNIANGNYSGTGNTGIIISKNMTIVGQSQTGTIINGTNSAQIFHIYSSDVNVTIWNLTFANGFAAADPVNQGYGGAIGNDGTCTISGCTFTGNTAARTGGAIWSDVRLVVNDCTFIGNTANLAGGAICINDCNCTISGCTFTGNTAQYGGAIVNSQDCTVNFSRFYGNTASIGSAILNVGNPLNAENNWWGSNANPMSVPNLIATTLTIGNNQVTGGAVDADPWIIMAYSVIPTTIHQGATSVLTADFRYNSDREYLNPALGHLPNGAPVTFKTNLGNVGSKSIVIGTLNGVATATLRGDETAGEALTSATLDGQLLTAPVIITQITSGTDPSTNSNGSSTNSTSSPTANAASSISKVNTIKTIPMQPTGVPLTGLVLAVLAVFSGLVLPKRK